MLGSERMWGLSTPASVVTYVLFLISWINYAIGTVKQIIDATFRTQRPYKNQEISTSNERWWSATDVINNQQLFLRARIVELSLLRYSYLREHFLILITCLYVCAAKIQISLHIAIVWSEPYLCVWINVGPLTNQRARSEDSDQTADMRRLVWVFNWCTCQLLPFAGHWRIYWPWHEKTYLGGGAGGGGVANNSGAKPLLFAYRNV